jgi:hypothetical protein
MHCLKHRGEVTEDVRVGRVVVFDQAENRLHAEGAAVDALAARRIRVRRARNRLGLRRLRLASSL